ncbi:ABC transporter permease [Pollutibacter soli]|uniref:ABC transporter permease n=1 Tax=Pollutibacter soli TaxID=3034157 RepID=UPI003013EA69
MIFYFIRSAARSLQKNRFSTAINITGLAVGMAVAILIGTWIKDELSYNSSFPNHSRIARVYQNQNFEGVIRTWNTQAMQLGPELRNSYGHLFKNISLQGGWGNHLLISGDKKLTPKGVFMEPSITDMLSLKMIKGSANGLTDMNSIIISSSLAKAIYGDADPINQVLQIDAKMNVKVSGVYRDIDENSSFGELQFFSPWELYRKNEDLDNRVGWGNSWFGVFVQLADGKDMAKTSLAIKDAKMNRVRGTEGGGAINNPVLFLHPMDKWRLYENFENGVNTGGRIQYLWMFGIIGIFVLLLACINFMNLSTARTEKKAKEVGIRKTVGSSRRQLVWQLYMESMLIAFFSLVAAIALSQLMIPLFNDIAGKTISLPWDSVWFWTGTICFALVTALLAGSYPAFYLSGFKPVKVLKGKLIIGQYATLPRKILVVTQFAVSAILIIGTMVVFRQIEFAKDRPIGYDQRGIVAVSMPSPDMVKRLDIFRNELLATGMIESMTATDTRLSSSYVTNSGFTWPGKDPGMQEEFNTLRVTRDFGKTVNWQIVQGRDFSKDFATDSLSFVLNETAVKYMGLKNPIGTVVRWGDEQDYTVVGVCKDLVMQSVYEPVRPMIFVPNEKRVSFANIKIKPEQKASEAIAAIKKVYEQLDNLNPFTYQFVDEEFAKKFGEEQKIGKLAGFFSGLAIFISMLGLFGLASFVAEKRIREIGIRKVLGASVFSVWQMLSKEFVILVFISLLIATPTAWYFMNQWLQNYQYRTTIAWWIFPATGLAALLITLLTVSFHSIKAALMNPVKSLRVE